MLNVHFGVTDFTTINNPRYEYKRYCMARTTKGLVRLFYLVLQTFYDPNNFYFIHVGSHVRIRVTLAHKQLANDLSLMRFQRQERRNYPGLYLALNVMLKIRRARFQNGSLQFTTIREIYYHFRNSFQDFLRSRGIHHAHEDFTSQVAHMDFETFMTHLNMDNVREVARRVLADFRELMPPPAPVPQ